MRIPWESHFFPPWYKFFSRFFSTKPGLGSASCSRLRWTSFWAVGFYETLKPVCQDPCLPDLTWSYLILLDLTWSYLRMSVRCQKSPGPQSPHHFRTYCLAKCLIAFQPAVVHSGCSKDLDNCEDDYRDYLRGLQPPPFGPSVVIQRPFVERVQLDLFHPFSYFTQFS